MLVQKVLNKIRDRRKKRVRAGISGTVDHPRMSVFRSNQFCYVQLIDDVEGKTLVSASTKELNHKGTKVSACVALGELIAKKAQEKGIKKVVFDRGGNKYHGRVKAIAEAARTAGLEF